MIACGMALILFLQLIQNKIDLFIISDRLCLLVLIFCTVSAIGISVKYHIGTSLVLNRNNIIPMRSRLVFRKTIFTRERIFVGSHRKSGQSLP